MGCSWDKVRLGRTGLAVTPLGLASSYGVAGADVERAVERGVNYLYWGSVRRPDFGAAIRRVARRRREELVVVIQSYSRFAWLLGRSLDRGLKALGLDHADILLLGWWNALPPPRIRDAARRLVERGKARHVMVSCHHRPSFETYAREPLVGAVMVRYNGAHPGAEQEVFPRLGADRPGVVAYTATRWGQLPDPRRTPPGEPTPRGSDCYRFALSHPSVDVVLAGPADAAQLDEALLALDRGPMDADEIAWMKRVGRALREARGLRNVIAGRAE